jgi:hypothetical protein
VNEVSAMNWSSVIPTTLFFMFILAGEIYMILNNDEKDIFQKLEIEEIPRRTS